MSSRQAQTVQLNNEKQRGAVGPALFLLVLGALVVGPLLGSLALKQNSTVTSQAIFPHEVSFDSNGWQQTYDKNSNTLTISGRVCFNNRLSSGSENLRIWARGDQVRGGLSSYNSTSHTAGPGQYLCPSNPWAFTLTAPMTDGWKNSGCQPTALHFGMNSNRRGGLDDAAIYNIKRPADCGATAATPGAPTNTPIPGVPTATPISGQVVSCPIPHPGKGADHPANCPFIEDKDRMPTLAQDDAFSIDKDYKIHFPWVGPKNREKLREFRWTVYMKKIGQKDSEVVNCFDVGNVAFGWIAGPDSTGVEEILPLGSKCRVSNALFRGSVRALYDIAAKRKEDGIMTECCRHDERLTEWVTSELVCPVPKPGTGANHPPNCVFEKTKEAYPIVDATKFVVDTNYKFTFPWQPPPILKLLPSVIPSVFPPQAPPIPADLKPLLPIGKPLLREYRWTVYMQTPDGQEVNCNASNEGFGRIAGNDSLGVSEFLSDGTDGRPNCRVAGAQYRGSVRAIYHIPGIRNEDKEFFGCCRLLESFTGWVKRLGETSSPGTGGQGPGQPGPGGPQLPPAGGRCVGDSGKRRVGFETQGEPNAIQNQIQNRVVCRRVSPSEIEVRNYSNSPVHQLDLNNTRCSCPGANPTELKCSPSSGTIDNQCGYDHKWGAAKGRGDTDILPPRTYARIRYAAQSSCEIAEFSTIARNADGSVIPCYTPDGRRWDGDVAFMIDARCQAGAQTSCVQRDPTATVETFPLSVIGAPPGDQLPPVVISTAPSQPGSPGSPPQTSFCTYRDESSCTNACLNLAKACRWTASTLCGYCETPPPNPYCSYRDQSSCVSACGIDRCAWTQSSQCGYCTDVLPPTRTYSVPVVLDIINGSSAYTLGVKIREEDGGERNCFPPVPVEAGNFRYESLCRDLVNGKKYFITTVLSKYGDLIRVFGPTTFTAPREEPIVFKLDLSEFERPQTSDVSVKLRVPNPQSGYIAKVKAKSFRETIECFSFEPNIVTYEADRSELTGKCAKLRSGDLYKIFAEIYRSNDLARLITTSEINIYVTPPETQVQLLEVKFPDPLPSLVMTTIDVKFRVDFANDEVKSAKIFWQNANTRQITSSSLLAVRSTANQHFTISNLEPNSKYTVSVQTYTSIQTYNDASASQPLEWLDVTDCDGGRGEILQPYLCRLLPGGSASFSKIILTAGETESADLTCDAKVTGADISLAAKNYGKEIQVCGKTILINAAFLSSLLSQFFSR